MSVQSCLLLVDSSRKRRPTAYIVAVPEDRDSQAFVRTIGDLRLKGYGRGFRFCKKHMLFQKPVVSVATLRQITVTDLEALPTTRALVQSACPDEALTDACLDPGSMDWAFSRHMFSLYDDIFTHVSEQDGHITLPRQALLIRDKTDPMVWRILGGIASLVSGGILLASKLAETR